MNKPLDVTLDIIEQQFIEKAAAENKMKPILDKQLYVIQKLDNQINWFENKIAEIEKEKELELRKMGDFLDLAMQSSHSLKNGFTVKPDNKRKIEVKNISAFMRWLKANKPPDEVFTFFKNALKLTSLKKFCEKEIENQRLNGEIMPSIDGIDFGEITYRRLTTVKKEKK